MNLLVVAIVAAVVLVSGANWDRHDDRFHPEAAERRRGLLMAVDTIAIVGLIVWFALNS